MDSPMIDIFVEWKDGGEIISLEATAYISHLRDAFVQRRLLQGQVDPSQVQVFDSTGTELKYWRKLGELGQLGQNPDTPLHIKMPDALLQPNNSTLATAIKDIQKKLGGIEGSMEDIQNRLGGMDDIQKKMDGMEDIKKTLDDLANGKATTAWPVRRHSNGVQSRVPEDFEFPQEGLYDLWMKWNIGDTEQKIPPLRILHKNDYCFLDNKPKPAAALQRSRTIKDNKEKRRSSGKIYSDIKFICHYIEQRAGALGMDTNDRGKINVRLMYEAVAPNLFPGGMPKMNNGRELKWKSICLRLRAKIKGDKEASTTPVDNL